MSTHIFRTLAVFLVTAAAAAQTPTNEIDSHIAIAKSAAGQDYRGTFVNLCLPGGGAPGGGRGAAAPAAPRGAAAPWRGRLICPRLGE